MQFWQGGLTVYLKLILHYNSTYRYLFELLSTIKKKGWFQTKLYSRYNCISNCKSWFQSYCFSRYTCYFPTTLVEKSSVKKRKKPSESSFFFQPKTTKALISVSSFLFVIKHKKESVSSFLDVRQIRDRCFFIASEIRYRRFSNVRKHRYCRFLNVRKHRYRRFSSVRKHRYRRFLNVRKHRYRRFQT